MRFVAHEPFQLQAEGSQWFSVQIFRHLLTGERQNFGPDEAGRFGGKRGGMFAAAEHPLIAAVGHVLGRFQMGIRAEPLAGAVEFAIELKQLGERTRTIAERAAELFVPRNLRLPIGESAFPRVVALKQAAEIPGVGGLYLRHGRPVFFWF